MNFADVQHQTGALRRLQQSLASDRLAHALLFAGPDGVGKEMAALRFARLLACAKPRSVAAPKEAGEPTKWRDACGECEDCLLFAGGGHPDVHRIHRGLAKLHPDSTVRSRKALDLSVDVVRHFLLEPIGRRAARGRAKVFIVCEADRLSIGAQNALLKTLEEPPDGSFIILLATSAGELLATTRSRCQFVQFASLPVEFVAERVAAALRLPPADAAYLAELSEGRLGPALRYGELGVAALRDVVRTSLAGVTRDPLATSKQLKEQADALAKNWKEDAAASETDATRQAQALLLAAVALALRDGLRSACGSSELPASGGELARLLSRRGLATAIRAVHSAETQIDQNANAALVFDGLAIAIAEPRAATARM